MKSTEKFIEECLKVHGDKYSYRKTAYCGVYTNCTITCKTHGDFEQSPHSHLRGHGCPKCSGKNKWTRQQFIEAAVKCHGTKYSYQYVEYKAKSKLVLIICPEHGFFEQRADAHVLGMGCRKCGLIETARKSALPLSDLTSKFIANGWELVSDYKNTRDLAVFKCCTCGAEKNLRPHNIIQESAQCDTCNSHGEFKTGIDGGVYLLVLESVSGELILGFGRANSLSRRLAIHKRVLSSNGWNILKIFYKKCDSKCHSISLEKSLLSLKHNKLLRKDIPSNFKREWLDYSQLNEALLILN